MVDNGSDDIKTLHHITSAIMVANGIVHPKVVPPIASPHYKCTTYCVTIKVVI